MHLVRVTPLASLPNTVPQVLDYFWPSPLPRASIVAVSIGRRSVQALVLESLDVTQAKLSIKKSAFGLKKITSIVSALPQFTAGQIAMAAWLSATYACGLGLCAKTVAPAWLGKPKKLLTIPEPLPVKPTETTPRIILTQPDTAIEHIKRVIAKAKGVTLIIVPEMILAEHLAKILTSHQPTLVHSGIGAPQQYTIHRAVLAGTTQLIIGTRVALFLPFTSITHIIVEDPSHEAYKSESAPRYNAPDVARHLASLHGAAITYLTPALTCANQYAIEKNILQSTDAKPYWPKVKTIDMAAERRDAHRGLFARTSQELILDAYEDHKSLLVLSPRRAYASAYSCPVCARSVMCPTCDIPMRAHRTTEDMLVCYHCTTYLQVPKRCAFCKASPLRPTGLAGSQKIAQAINQLLDRHGLPKQEVPILDSDLVRTQAQEDAILAQYDALEHPILVATHMIMSHRYTRTFDAMIVVEADALAWHPDFRTQERLVQYLEKLADLHPQVMLIQTLGETAVLAAAPERAWSDVLTHELSSRKVFGWPPFTRLTRLTFRHRDQRQSAQAARLAVERLTRTAQSMKAGSRVQLLGPTPALVAHAQGQWSQNILLKTTLASADLGHLLAHLPPGWMIDIDPRSIA